MARGTRAGMTRITARRAFRPNTALNKVKKQLAAAQSKSRALRKQVKAGKGAGATVGAAACVTAGGAAAGAVSVYMPQVVGISTPLVAGAGLVVASAFIRDQKIAGPAACLGSGMLAAWAAGHTANFVQSSASPAAGPTIVNGG